MTRGGERGLRPARPRPARRATSASAWRACSTWSSSARFRERLPRQLSGGQQQRVALARALAVEPSILLLDEPFAALDRNLRLDMQIEVKRLQRQLGLTTILVTHDQDEAMSVADRIAVMNKGTVEQFDTPVAIYDRPQTLFVNGFIGTDQPAARQGHGRSTTTSPPWRSTPAPRLRLPAPTGIARRRRRRCCPSGPSSSRCRPSPTPGSWPIEPGLSLPLGSQLVHEARTADGAALKIVEPRLRAPAGASARLLRAWRPTPAPRFSRVPPIQQRSDPMMRQPFSRRTLLAGACRARRRVAPARRRPSPRAASSPRPIPAPGKTPIAPSSCRC